jgi:hypothetical protein
VGWSLVLLLASPVASPPLSVDPLSAPSGVDWSLVLLLVERHSGSGCSRHCRPGWVEARVEGGRRMLRGGRVGPHSAVTSVTAARTKDSSTIGARADTELAVDVREVEVELLRRKRQLCRDLIVRVAAGEEAGEARFRRGESLEGHRAAACAVALTRR